MKHIISIRLSSTRWHIKNLRNWGSQKDIQRRTTRISGGGSRRRAWRSWRACLPSFWSGSGSGGEFVRELAKKGKKLVVVTNSPYLDCPEFDTVIISYGNSPKHAEEIARKLFE